MIRNPIYRALVATGLMKSISRGAEKCPETRDAYRAYRDDADAINGLCERGVISHAECFDLTQRAARSYHASVLHELRRSTKLTDRRRLFRSALRFHAEGVRI